MVLSDLHGSDRYPVLIHISTLWPALKFSPHWILAKANRTLLKDSATLTTGDFGNVNNMADCFTTAVLSAAESAIPVSSGIVSHPPVPWWNVDSAAAVYARKRSLDRLRHHPTMENLVTYKRILRS